ncbi:LysR family transcriptional regulator [Rhodospirillum sp. A1_3_36]|uniref:LysR family transcriptional regulator n=1 Tax=Rhodospirillum sp. A1_3_36 TaxID=3391666 RepID=UPI0039A695A8
MPSESPIFDLALLRAFIMVARLKSVSKAAERLHRVQSTISLQIQRLETQMDHPLFQRGKNSFELTDFGKAFYPHAVQLMDMNDQIYDKLSSGALARTLVIGTSDIYASTMLADILGQYHKTVGWSQTEVICDYSPAIWKMFEEGRLDVAIAQARPPAIEGDDLAVDPLVWVQAPGFKIKSGPLPLALFGEGCVERAVILKRLNDENIAFDIVSESAYSAGVMATVRAGIAITALPRSVVASLGVRPYSGKGLPSLGNSHLSMAWKAGSRNEHVHCFRDYVGTYFSLREMEPADAAGLVPFLQDLSEHFDEMPRINVSNANY